MTVKNKMKRYDRKISVNDLTGNSEEKGSSSDSSELNEKFWDNLEVFEPREKKPVSLRIDEDILEFFKKDGSGYQSRINAVLKAYVEAMRSKENSGKGKR